MPRWGLIVVAAGLAAYANSLTGPFIFDDASSIVDNPAIRRLWPVSSVIESPPGTAISGRPSAALTFALNYAISGLKPWSYHVVNLAIHLLTALALFGLIRRTLARQAGINRSNALGIAAASSMLWVVHPLTTQSVTYITQRVESLMALGYALTLYCLARSAASRRPWRWNAAAVAACAIGMGSKPVMVTAPVVALCYDRIFLARSWRELWRVRWPLYVGLASTWAIAWISVAGNPPAIRAPLPWFEYALQQPGVILRYLRLAVWPSPLVLDYAPLASRPVLALVPSIIGFLALFGAIAWGTRREPRLAFLGAVVLAILAPTTSVIPAADMAEHRMYLPLAAVLVAIVLAGDAWLRRAVREAAARRALAMCLVGMAVIGLAAGTIRRNAAYQNEIGIWQDTAAKQPTNSRAFTNLSMALARAARYDASIEMARRAVALDPSNAEAHNNLGVVLHELGRLADARHHYEHAIRVRPTYAKAHANLGDLLLDLNRPEEAAGHYHVSVRLNPLQPAAWHQLAILLTKQGRYEEALEKYQRALALDPANAEAQNNLGVALESLGRLEEAAAAYRRALVEKPDYEKCRANLQDVLKRLGRAQNGA